jgi:hypothetical protein
VHLEPESPPNVNPRVVSLVQRELEERRFSALAQAVRQHEARARAQLLGERPYDIALYRRLRQLCSGC